MSNSDTPPLQMVVVEGPRLAPATGGDAERLDTWRIGSKVSVQFVRNGSRPMERKWWSVLGLVVNQCDVPWTTKESASQAIKLALGLVDYAKTIHGKFMQWPKSLTELTDPELDDAVRDMMDLIHKMTGVDPETLRKESADVGHEDHSQNGAVDEKPDTIVHKHTSINTPAAADQEGGAKDDASPSEQDAPARDLMQECIDKMLRVATDVDVPDPRERRGILETAKNAWKESVPGHHEFVKQCFVTADKVVKGELPADKARQYLEGLL